MSFSRGYARAFLEVLGSKASDDFWFDQSLRSVREFWLTVCGSKELRVVFLGFGIPLTQQKSLLGAFCEKFGLDKVWIDFFVLLLKKRRMEFLPEILRSIQKERLKRMGGVLGLLESEKDISEEQAKALKEVFEKKTGKKIEWEFRREPTLLAGVRVTVMGVTYDGSLRAQLNRLKKEVYQCE